MSKLLVIGDPHLSHKHLNRSIDLLKWIERVADEQDVDVVINLGDTFDTHSVLHSPIVSEFRRHIERMNTQARPYIILVGNHDQFKPNDATYHALQCFKDLYKGFMVVDRPLDWEGMSFVPYVQANAPWPVAQEQPILFCHATFSGASLNRSKVVEDGIDGSCIHADLVVSGHIHRRQLVRTNIIYPGTPLATSASDVDQEKGLMILDTDTLRYSYIPSPFPMWRSHTFILNESPDLSFPDLEEKDHHVVTLIGTKAELKAAIASKQMVEARKRLSMQVRIEAVDSKKEERVSIKAPTPISMVEAYLEKVYQGSLDAEVLRTLASKYIEG